MGRAYEVRKASIQKTGAAKAKLYSMYAREIYQIAKRGGVDENSNLALRRILEKARKDQVPNDIIKRAIDKVTSGVQEDYEEFRFEIFGPSGSTIIVEGLTDNINRTISDIRPILNKNNGKMGVTGSVTYLYENLAVLKFGGLGEEEILETLIENDIDIVDVEVEETAVVVYGKPQDFYRIKEAISKKLPTVNFEVEEITWIPNDQIELQGEDLESFNKMIDLLDDLEDVKNVYHNVK